MSLYKQKYNPLAALGFNLVPTSNVITFKSGVANQASLPLTGNTQNDARIANDTGLLYVWSIASSSGLLTDWISQGDILDYTWDGLSGKPSSSPTNIDDAVSKRHTQGTDQGLDTGGANATTAAQVKQAVTDDHTHSNKTILDNIQEALTTILKSAYDGAVSLSHASGSDNQSASSVPFTPNGDIAAVNTQTAIQEVRDDTDIKLGNKAGLPQQIVTVGQANAQFTTIQGAIDSITDASASKPYIVFVYPGIYTENIVMKSFVDIVGINKNSCIITHASINTVASANDSRIKNFTITNTNASLTRHAIWLNHTTNTFEIHDCYIYKTTTGSSVITIGSDSDIKPLKMYNCTVEATVISATSDSSIAIYRIGDAEIKNCKITATGGDVANNAIQLRTGGTQYIFDCQLNSVGSTASDAAPIYCDSTVAYLNDVLLNNTGATGFEIRAFSTPIKVKAFASLSSRGNSLNTGATLTYLDHSNKTILDAIQESLTTVLKNSYDACVTFIGNFALGTPNVNDHLAWNGSQFVPSAPQISGFKGVDLFLDDTPSGILTYNTLAKIPVGGSEVLDNIVVNANTVHAEDYISDMLGGIQIDAGVWEFDIYRYISSGTTTGTTELIFEIYKRTSGGTETLLFTIATGDVNDTVNTLQSLTTVQSAFAINPTDRLLLKVYGHRIEANNRTITFSHNGTTHYSHIHTPLVLRHNDLAGLQGGTSGEFYHLTSAEYAALGSLTGSIRNTFTNASLSAGILTVTHNLGLSVPYMINVVIFDNNNKQIIPDEIIGLTNSVQIDLSSFGTLTGTWGYMILS